MSELRIVNRRIERNLVILHRKHRSRTRPHYHKRHLYSLQVTAVPVDSSVRQGSEERLLVSYPAYKETGLLIEPESLAVSGILQDAAHHVTIMAVDRVSAGDAGVGESSCRRKIAVKARRYQNRA